MQVVTKNAGESVETPLTLKANQLVTFKRAQGTCLECMQGSVWVTLENDPLDFVLSPGERVCIHTPGRMVIEGLELSKIAIAPTRRHSLARKLVARLGHCIQSAFRFITNSNQCPVQHSVDPATTYHGSFRL